MITIVLPISRPYFLQSVFNHLEYVLCDPKEVSLLTYVDGDQRLYEKARNLTVNSRFNQKLCVYRAKGQPSAGSVKRRRKRIADIHNELKQYINDSDYIFCLEDDTLIPPQTISNLYKKITESVGIGFVSGVELGRWGYKHIGAWEVDDVYDTNIFTSIPHGQGIRKVDAAGMYCCMINSVFYLRHHFEPFEDVAGPDVNFGLYLRRQGLTNYVDYSIKCTHLSLKEEIKYDPNYIVQVELKREDTRWSQGLKKES